MVYTPATPLTALTGVGPARAKKLEKLGLTHLGNLLDYYPHRYEDRRTVYTIREAPAGECCCVCAMVADYPTLSHIRKGMDLVKLRVVDHTGQLYLTFFNQSYLREVFRPGDSYVFFGKVEAMGHRRSMTSPAFEPEGRGQITGRILPVYPLTAGVSNQLLLSLAQQAVEHCTQQAPDAIPAPVRLSHQLCQREFALQNIHFPKDYEALALARRRLIFEEFFTLTCGLGLLKERRVQGEGTALPPPPMHAYLSLLPFTPTGAQRRAMEDIAGDIARPRPMNRLVMGDVGSGKTVVAAYAAWAAACNGVQCALMAPTELLAEQHYRTLTALLSPAGVSVALLTGSVKGKERKAIRSQLEQGALSVAVGTHALFSEEVHYARLGLVITDEQHRFGVAQRAALAAKGSALGAQPHVLVMSATPIPRTLALLIYGDLEVSILDELPPGRTPISTFAVGEAKRQGMYGFIREQVAQGRQVYIVCPAVGDTEGLIPLPQEEDAPDLKAATAYAQQLQTQVFPHLRVGLVHGKMKAREKESVMSAFSQGQVDILVSTTVIEVGVDVPNATVMIVENAERFGLSQLHQLRGRVGRGCHKSWCILVSASRGEAARERLRTLCRTTDGFEIAEADLTLRGPGDFFGKRQHGLPQLKVADFASDVELLHEARDAAQALLAQDPDLSQPEHALLRQRVGEIFAQEADTFN